MRAESAKALVALLVAEFGEMPPSKVALYVEELAPFEYEDALAGIRELMRAERFLHLADVLAYCDSAMRKRLEREDRDRPVSALPPVEECLPEDEIAARAAALRARLAGKGALGDAITEALVHELSSSGPEGAA